VTTTHNIVVFMGTRLQAVKLAMVVAALRVSPAERFPPEAPKLRLNFPRCDARPPGRALGTPAARRSPMTR
jgi:hypothetical protein